MLHLTKPTVSCWVNCTHGFWRAASTLFMQIQGGLQPLSQMLSSMLQSQWKTFRCKKNLSKFLICQKAHNLPVLWHETHKPLQWMQACTHRDMSGVALHEYQIDQCILSIPDPIKMSSCISVRKKKKIFLKTTLFI